MGEDIRALRTRIKSVDSTLHLTNAMGLVASSKIRRASTAATAAEEYSSLMTETLKSLAASPICRDSVYSKEGAGPVKVIVIAGDRGLAGGYNSAVFKKAAEYEGCEVIPIGKRACDKYKKASVSAEKFSAADSGKLAAGLCEDFKSGKMSRLVIIGTKYVSMLENQVYAEEILPIKPPENARPFNAEAEPDEKTVLEQVIGEYLTGAITAAVKESFLCELAARRTAMDNAGKNATAMIDDLTLRYNRARQSAITQEITEIVAGGDA